MFDILNKTIVLVLNHNWQAINIRTPQDAFCQMATNVATALDIEFDDEAAGASLRTPCSEFRASGIRPVHWDEWITLPVREGDYAVRTARGAIRVPTVIVAVNYARVPKKRPKLSAKNIRERDGNCCQYTAGCCTRTRAASTTSCPARAVARTRGKTSSGPRRK
jgi:hypothetical protein